MEEILEYSSSSVSSIMSLDKSDTNQSDKKVTSEDSKASKTEKEKRNFAQISDMRDEGEVDSFIEKSADEKDKETAFGFDEMDIEDADDDLKELNSEMLSKQMSKVVTQLENQVLDDSEKNENAISLDAESSIDSKDFTKAEENKIEDKVKDAVDDIEQDNSSLEGEKQDEAVAAAENEVKTFADVQIKVIDIPEDDDLFDFLKHPFDPDHADETSNISDAQEKQDLEDLKQRELYRLLTENNQSLSQSNEVTPYQSGDENRSDSESSDRSGTTEELLSESDSDHDQSSCQHISYTDVYEGTESRPETPSKEEPVETPVKVRRKPGPKPRLDKPPKKPKLTPGQLTEKTLEKLEKCKIATNKWLQDLQVPEALSLEKPLRFDIVDLNPYLTCGLCKGYLYEASTITECMHTFCKNCIVRHCMEVSLHCPVCNILIHPTDPFVHIRLDRMIQDIVYKILPNVAETEMKNIKAFYVEHPEDQPKVIKEEPLEIKTSPKEKEIKSPRCQPQMVSLLLESENDTTESESIESLEKKFVRVTSTASVRNVCDFLRKKLGLDDTKQVDLFCCGDAMEDDILTLEKIKTKFFGDEDSLILLQYRVRET